MRLVIDLPARNEQMAFNRQRWAELVADPDLAELPFRIETNVHGQIVMNPPPTGEHSYRQSMILLSLQRLSGGKPLPECPVSTIDGIKAVDVGWYSDARFELVRGQAAFEQAPEICVEVVSPSNSRSELNHKQELYFEAGAVEVWFCETDGVMKYFCADQPGQSQPKSSLCPDFTFEA